MRLLHPQIHRVPISLLSIPLLSATCFLPVPILGQTPDERPTFTLPDNSMSFRYPKEWKISQEGSHVKIAADGVVFLLDRDSPTSFPSGDPTLSTELRSRAEAIATPLLSKPTYAGVKPLNLSGGSGAIFRFKSPSASSEIVEVWFVQTSGHNITIAPEVVSPSTHSLELVSLVRTLTFSGSTSNKPTPSGTKASSPTTTRVRTRQTNTTAVATAQSAATPVSTQPAERYEGRLISSDTSFVLRIYRGGTATAEWTRGNGNLLKYAGSYTGEDGNYSVKMDSQGAASGPRHLNLLVKSIGGMVNAQYTLDSPPARDASSLKLMEVDAGDVKLKGSKSGATAMSSGRQRGAGARRRKR